MTAKSLVSVLKKVKLPKLAFHLDEDGRITKLINLRSPDEKSRQNCGCTIIVGDDVVTEEEELQTHTNKCEISLEDCYASLKEAMEALRIQKMQRARDEFVSSLVSRHYSQDQIVKFLRKHPEPVLVWLLENTDLENPPANVEELKRTHYYKAINGLGSIKKVIADAKFPELAKEDNAEEDDY